VPHAEPQVEFFVLEEASARSRLRAACRIVERAYLADQRVLVWCPDPQELRDFDEMLWTFSDRSFVPHELLGGGAAPEAPVLLSAGTVPGESVDLLVNLGPEVPPYDGLAARIAEVIDGDPGRRQAGRTRFRAYRERGLQPVSHNLQPEQAGR